jgi:hypothetical protein
MDKNVYQRFALSAIQGLEKQALSCPKTFQTGVHVL